MKKEVMLCIMATMLILRTVLLGVNSSVVSAGTVNDTGTNIGMENAVNFSIGDVIKGNLSEADTADFYKFTVSKEGRLDLKYFTEIEGCFSQIYNEDGEKIWDTADRLLNWDNVTHSLTYKTCAYLRNGTYYLTIVKYNDYTGNYSISTDFIESKSNISEPNDSFATAKTIKLNSNVKGIIDEEEETDIFKFSVSNSCDLKLKMNVDGVNSDFSAYIYDIDGNRIWDDGDTFKNWDNSLTATKSLSLNRGTYYLALSYYNYRSSMYSFKLNINKKSQTITLKNICKLYTKSSVKKSKKTFNIGAKAKGKITYKVTSGSKYVSVSSSGKLTIKKGTPKGIYEVKVSAASTPYYKAANKTVVIKVK